MKFILLDTSKILYMMFFSSCGLSSVKFVKQITDLSRARYFAHFDTKLSSIVIFLVPKRLLSSS
ncbi:hypothetical protein T03_5355 [Trichinella britovi]|uniref:Uncharacterized protein n=1 Tax=Trichinella britovi TaxID=45882 RepID=A0A0V1CTH7_TRIBR|nr:hypothetical protein T03_5355 [Trichinella britovi]KRZ94181.1 hypothetical protein T08_9514 [Trichinella sp. T8]